jgi:hypothetical protein
MYSKTSERNQFFTRTGSHSQRFRLTGDNSDLSGNQYDTDYTADKAAASIAACLHNRGENIAYESIFVAVAKAILPEDVYEDINEAAKGAYQIVLGGNENA